MTTSWRGSHSSGVTRVVDFSRRLLAGRRLQTWFCAWPRRARRTVRVCNGLPHGPTLEVLESRLLLAAPFVSAPASAIANGHSIIFSAAKGNAIKITDPSGTAEQLSINATNGTMSFVSTAGLTFIAGGNGTGAMTLTGTSAAINTALQMQLLYVPNSGYTGADAITVIEKKGQ